MEDLTRNKANEQYEDSLYKYKYKVFESILASTSGNVLPDDIVDVAINAFFLTYAAEVYKSGQYVVDRTALGQVKAELNKIKKNDLDRYPWGKMVKGIVYLIDRKHEKAYKLIHSAVEQGLDNILAFIALYIIKVRQNDLDGAELELDNIERKDGNDSPIVYALREKFETDRDKLNHQEHNAIEIFSVDRDSMLRPRLHTHERPYFKFEGYLNDGYNTVFLGLFWYNKLQEPVNGTPAYFAFTAYRMLYDAHENFYRSDEKRLKDALDNVNVALSRNDQYTWAYYVRSCILYSQGEYYIALKDIHKAVVLGFKNSGSLYLKFLIKYKLGYIEESLRDLKDAIRMTSDLSSLADMHLSRIKVLVKQGEVIFHQIGIKEDYE